MATCHDLLAVRSASGEFPGNRVGLFGRLLQRLILAGLKRCSHVACVSEATRKDLQRLAGALVSRVSVVPNGLNYPFRPMAGAEAEVHVNGLLGVARARGRVSSDGTRPRYVLHVGGNHWYKNRAGVLQIYARLVELMPDAPDLVMVGPALPDEQCRWIGAHGLGERVLVVGQVGNEGLRALYSCAELLLFPSLAEGFGWPILEAQACDCLVVTANCSSMPEVGGSGAYYCDPRDVSSSAAVLQHVLSAGAHEKSQRLAQTRANVARFSTEAMIHSYRKLYEQLLAS